MSNKGLIVSGALLTALGIILLILAIVLHFFFVEQGAPWWLWFIFAIGALLGLIGIILMCIYLWKKRKTRIEKNKNEEGQTLQSKNTESQKKLPSSNNTQPRKNLIYDGSNNNLSPDTSNVDPNSIFLK